MSTTRKLGARSNTGSRRSSLGAASTASSMIGNRKGSTTDHSSKTGRLSTNPGGPTVTAPSTPSVSGPSSSSAALKRSKHATHRTPAIQTQSSPPESKQHTSSLQWSSTKVIMFVLYIIQFCSKFRIIFIIYNKQYIFSNKIFLIYSLAQDQQ